MNDLKNLMNDLKINSYPEYWNEIYNDAMYEYKKEGNFFVSDDYILDLNNRYKLFNKRLNVVLNAAAKTRTNSKLLKFIWLLRYAMYDRDKFLLTRGEINLPTAPTDEDPIPYDFAPLFALLPTVPNVAKVMEERNVPEDIIFSTLNCYENTLDVFEKRFGRPGFNSRYFNWCQLFVDATILQIGRLHFEMRDEFPGNIKVFRNQQNDVCILMTDDEIHRDGMILGSAGYEDEEGAYKANFYETDEYYEGYTVGDNGLVIKRRKRLLKSEWSLVLDKGDPVLSVHIPATGESLSNELCEESYKRAGEIFLRCYPEFKYKAFMCFSWMMDPQLKQLLKPESNIVKFQDKYMCFTLENDGQDVFIFIFKKPVEDLKDLPENTSIERAVKKHYLNGKYIYVQGGIFLK